MSVAFVTRNLTNTFVWDGCCEDSYSRYGSKTPINRPQKGTTDRAGIMAITDDTSFDMIQNIYSYNKSDRTHTSTAPNTGRQGALTSTGVLVLYDDRTGVQADDEFTDADLIKIFVNVDN